MEVVKEGMQQELPDTGVKHKLDVSEENVKNAIDQKAIEHDMRMLFPDFGGQRKTKIVKKSSMKAGLQYGQLNDTTAQNQDTPKEEELVFPKQKIHAIIREIVVEKMKKTDIEFDDLALEALHTACESYLLEFFQDLQLTAAHDRRVTVMAKDLSCVFGFRGINLKK